MPINGPTLELSTREIDFGNQPRGTTSAARSIVLTNTGNGPLALGDITLAGSWNDQYAITAGGGAAVIQPGESHTVSVLFAPSLRYESGGDRNNARILIRSHIGAERDAVHLRGFVTVPGARIEPGPWTSATSGPASRAPHGASH